MGLKRNLEAGYTEWSPDWSMLSSAQVSARTEGRFAQVSPFVYRLGTKEYDFEPFLADPECFGQPKHIDGDYAFKYLIYRRLCRRGGIQPDDFVDERYYVRLNLDTPDGSDVEVVSAEDC